MKSYRIPELAKKYADHEMIQTYTELPEFPDSRIRLLFAFLTNQKAPFQHSELYSLVVSLVQLGMDTHDLIDSDSGHVPEREMRSRQLKVLAGDYFSSRFYHLLAQAGQVDMVKRISEGVCEVNKLKMNLYVKMKQLRVTAEDYLDQSIGLKTELFRVFTDMLDDEAITDWRELLQGFGRCEVLVEELARSEKPERFGGSWGYWHVLEEGNEEEKRKLVEKSGDLPFASALLAKYDIRSMLAGKLKQSISHVLSYSSKLDPEKLMRELIQIGESFQRPLIAAVSVHGERR
ncbi:heptaprenyl diphosphate synthase component 1 [Paenibacillus nasutitermitis]|uniref:Heptaprenyl diphosphate synthase n=1 Tax=Paenibacillus nasutitermitis TaxID=1652958 RepID=A0A916Z0X9_9BACL|nr:heptaprenyl diphosphate synthase component 1 [Paenibacillus nasutitermitis]GGD69228.1 hypothetical protein GCM10010911_28840 [Paenibacillus nasutitermitis]